MCGFARYERKRVEIVDQVERGDLCRCSGDPEDVGTEGWRHREQTGEVPLGREGKKGLRPEEKGGGGSRIPDQGTLI